MTRIGCMSYSVAQNLINLLVNLSVFFPLVCYHLCLETGIAMKMFLAWNYLSLCFLPLKIPKEIKGI